MPFGSLKTVGHCTKSPSWTASCLRRSVTSYMIVVRHVPDSRVEQVLCKLPAYRLKNKSLLSGSTELVAEVRLDDAAMKKLEGLRDDPEVMEISIMASVSGTAL